MPVILGEASILTTPLSGVRIWALVSGCLTFSLAASMGVPNPPPQDIHFSLFRNFCMFTWCFFFTMSLLILAITYVQFHSLLPFSWKNLTVTVAALAALMTFVATVLFPCLVAGKGGGGGQSYVVTTTIFSSLNFLAYAAETHLLRREQRGYMASVPGLLKVLQVFGGTMALLLVVDQAAHGVHPGWREVGPGVAYGLCLAASLFTVAVMVGDCAGRCPLPFDRVLAGLSLLGVLLYMVAAVMSSTKVLQMHQEKMRAPEEKLMIISEMVFACITLLSYTVDLAFSIKLLCDRN
ncbi:hypothetical protein ACEWY4_018296 [Coilia grayii]|uniref:MARVEL domain-containing protein n=1 Tax=Coilia grayii TaxID=363190 RepID=A0ABD1JJI6_9TELE